jgi:3-hydroxybutyryl-CoA dehydratase
MQVFGKIFDALFFDIAAPHYFRYKRHFAPTKPCIAMQQPLQPRDTYETSFSFSQEQVAAFAALTGDSNPVHLDAAYAAQTVFRRPIMHGMLSACIFSKVLGMEFPGEGTVYLGQTLDFKRPMYPGETYWAVFVVEETVPAKGTASISTTVYDAERKRVLVEGVAQLRNKGRIFPADAPTA